MPNELSDGRVVVDIPAEIVDHFFKIVRSASLGNVRAALVNQYGMTLDRFEELRGLSGLKPTMAEAAALYVATGEKLPLLKRKLMERLIGSTNAMGKLDENIARLMSRNAPTDLQLESYPKLKESCGISCQDSCKLTDFGSPNTLVRLSFGYVTSDSSKNAFSLLATNNELTQHIPYSWYEAGARDMTIMCPDSAGLLTSELINKYLRTLTENAEIDPSLPVVMTSVDLNAFYDRNQSRDVVGSTPALLTASDERYVAMRGFLRNTCRVIPVEENILGPFKTVMAYDGSVNLFVSSAGHFKWLLENVTQIGSTTWQLRSSLFGSTSKYNTFVKKLEAMSVTPTPLEEPRSFRNIMRPNSLASMNAFDASVESLDASVRASEAMSMLSYMAPTLGSRAQAIQRADGQWTMTTRT